MAFLENAHVSRVPTCLFYPIHSVRELNGVVKSYALHVRYEQCNFDVNVN